MDYEYKTIIGRVSVRPQRPKETYTQYATSAVEELLIIPDPVSPEGDGWKLTATVFLPSSTANPGFVVREWRRKKPAYTAVASTTPAPSSAYDILDTTGALMTVRPPLSVTSDSTFVELSMDQGHWGLVRCLDRNGAQQLHDILAAKLATPAPKLDQCFYLLDLLQSTMHKHLVWLQPVPDGYTTNLHEAKLASREDADAEEQKSRGRVKAIPKHVAEQHAETLQFVPHSALDKLSAWQPT
jgi:hypothetical protein